MQGNLGQNNTLKTTHIVKAPHTCMGYTISNSSFISLQTNCKILLLIAAAYSVNPPPTALLLSFAHYIFLCM